MPGVLEAEVTGGLDREIRIEVDPDKLAYYRIPIVSLQQSIASENQNTSGGAITLGDGRYQLKIPGEFQTPEGIYSLVVATHIGRPVLLTAVTTILGLLPMVTGISFDFHIMEISLVSWSSQWWRSMAIVVISGLAIAAILTLVVVPTLFVVIEDIRQWLTKQFQSVGDRIAGP